MGCLSRKKRIKQGGVKGANEDLKRRKQVENSVEYGGGKPALRVSKVGGVSSVLGFKLEDLFKASAEVLGKGTLWTTYKAFLDTGTTMVVRRMRNIDFTEKIFIKMVVAIEKINHENLFPFRAYCYSKDERFLVHDYMPMGSLSAILHGKSRTPLNFDTRIGIALGVARAIAHLHSQTPLPSLTYDETIKSSNLNSHGSIKSSNVLLTSTFEARVSDYGLTQFSGPTAVSNHVDGYRAPEVIYTNHITQKADVYSYGVLFLELLTGKDPNGSHLKDEGLDLPRWMLSAINDEWTSKVFDVELLQEGHVEEVLLELLELAFRCTNQYPYNRPSIELLCYSRF